MSEHEIAMKGADEISCPWIVQTAPLPHMLAYGSVDSSLVSRSRFQFVTDADRAEPLVALA
jgi:hypothetical protein